MDDEENPISVQAELDKEALKLTLTHVSGTSSDFLLSNQYEIIPDYNDTSLYAEVLFYDTDKNGQDEIWIAISDRFEIGGTTSSGIWQNSEFLAFKLENGRLTELPW